MNAKKIFVVATIASVLVLLATSFDSSLQSPFSERLNYDRGYVSMIEVISMPEKFQDRSIMVTGFLVFDREMGALYVNKEDGVADLSKNALLIHPNDYIRNQRHVFDKKYVSMRGVFDGSDDARSLRFAGAVSDIRHISIHKNGDGSTPKNDTSVFFDAEGERIVKRGT